MHAKAPDPDDDDAAGSEKKLAAERRGRFVHVQGYRDRCRVAGAAAAALVPGSRRGKKYIKNYSLRPKISVAVKLYSFDKLYSGRLLFWNMEGVYVISDL